MNGKFNNSLFSNLKYDISSGIVVFLVALPLCLGIALASGAELFTGLVTGIIGGIIVGALSGSHLAVSGPAAGLAVIVMDSIHAVGYPMFTVAVVISGILQLALGYLKAGTIGNFFPSSVIKGMLAAIGIILILKQIPHALGDDLDYFGNINFQQWDKKNTFTEILAALKNIKPAAIIISMFSLLFLVVWQSKWCKKLNFIPGPLLVVIFGILINIFIRSYDPTLSLGSEHLVTIPASGSLSQFTSNFIFPDWLGFFSAKSGLIQDVLKIAVTLAIIASIETLLSIEAVDKLDPQKRVTPTNRELKAQGVGNVIAGLLGGLPMTAVIVRGSANVAAGAKTKMSAIFHGFFLLFSLLAIPNILNMIPLASLAAILFLVGYKLTSVGLFKKMINKGFEHAIPFFVTIIAILFSNLLIGIGIGMAVSLVFILTRNMRNPFQTVTSPDNAANSHYIKLSQEVSFLNKASVINTLQKIPKHAQLTIDASAAKYIDDDVLEVIEDFSTQAKHRDINLKIIGLKDSYRLGKTSANIDVPEKATV